MYNINRRKFLGYFGCGCCSLLLPSCSTVPITERKQLSIIPESRINAQAAAAYEQILNNDGEHVPAMTLLAQVYLSQQRPQEAISALKKAISLDDTWGAAHQGLAQAYKQVGEVALSEEHRNRALQLKGENQ